MIVAGNAVPNAIACNGPRKFEGPAALLQQTLFLWEVWNQRFLPKWNSTSTPGPVWAPMTAPT